MVKRKTKGESGCSKPKRSKPGKKELEGIPVRRTRSNTRGNVDRGKRDIDYGDDTSDSEYSEKIVFKKKRLRKNKKSQSHHDSGPNSDESSGEIVIKKQVFRKLVVSDTDPESTSDGARVKAVKKKMKHRSNNISNAVLDAPTSDYTSDSDRDLRKTRINPSNYFEHVTIEEGVTYYCSNMETTIKHIKEMEFAEYHIAVIKRIPSWYMFEAIQKNKEKKLKKRCHKHDEDIRKILLCYDLKTSPQIRKLEI